MRVNIITNKETGEWGGEGECVWVQPGRGRGRARCRCRRTIRLVYCCR